MYQSTTIVGNLGTDPELRYTASGDPMTTFSVAVNERDKTTWFRVTVFGSQAEPCNQYLRKGRPVLVVGRLQYGEDGNPRQFTRKDGTNGTSFELTAQVVKFLSGGQAVEQSADVPF